MKIAALLSAAVFATCLASSAWASPPGGGGAPAYHFTMPTPTSKTDMAQIRAAAARSYSHSPVSHGNPQTANELSVSVTPRTTGNQFPKVQVIARGGFPSGMGPTARANFLAVKRYDPTTGKTAWKLESIKYDGRVWSRLKTFTAPPGAQP